MTKLSNGIQDAKIVGSFAREAGLSILLGILCLGLVVLLILDKGCEADRIAVGTDRWTGADQKKFVVEVINPMKNAISEHESMPAHREGRLWRAQELERMERMERKIDMILKRMK